MVQQQSYKIFISAAESSGDKHAAKLITAIKTLIPRVQVSGLGGPAMAEAGCKVIENLVDRSAMLTGAVSQIRFYKELKNRVGDYFKAESPDVVVVIDSPAWNFHVAEQAKKLQIPVLYYIAPQLWAWGGWRLNKLKRLTDRIACILPFEQKWFADRGVRVDYVGHPLFDDEHAIPAVSPWSQPSNQYPTVALLPGSREQELVNHWPLMISIAKYIREKYPNACFRTAASSPKNFDYLQKNLPPDVNIDIRQVSLEATVRHADLTLVVSGTATLEVAAQNCPMIIVYYVPPLHWHLVGRWLIKTRYLSLVNILAGRELVPEFMPFFTGHTDRLIRKALMMLDDPEQLQKMRLSLRQFAEPIIQPGASAKVADIVRQMLPKY